MMSANQAVRSHITTHVLDTGIGCPAVGVRATLEAKTASGWKEIGSGVADADGRITMLGPTRVNAGQYRITFGTGDYFGKTETETFFPAVSIDFVVSDTAAHYHVPLLISPYAYSTYRGS
jgi:5-hydroxyisourate hydrolase